MRHFSWLVLVFICSELLAQKPLYSNYQHFDVEDGLPQNLITDLAEDGDGFIWCSTLDGLARYDGKSFLLFQNNPKSLNRIKSNTISRLFWDSSSREIIVSYHDQFIQRFNPQNFKLSSIEFKSIDLGTLSTSIFLENSLDRLWHDRKNFLGINFFAANDGSTRVILKSEVTDSRKWITFLEAWQRLPKNIIYDMAEDEQRQLWILTTHGIEVSDTTWSKFSLRPFPDILKDKLKNQPNRVRLVHLSNNRIAIFKGHELLVYNKSSNSYESIEINADREIAIGRKHHAPITFDNQGRLIIEYNSGVYRLEDDNSVTLLWKMPSHHVVRTILIDRSNTLWVGTDMGGLYKINLLKGHFTSRKYQNSFAVDVFRNELRLINSADLKMLTNRNSFTFRFKYSPANDLIFQVDKISPIYDHNLFLVRNSRIITSNYIGPGILGVGHNKDLIYLAWDHNLYKLDAGSLAELARDNINIPLNPHSALEENNRVVDLLVEDEYQWIISQAKGIHLVKNKKVERSLELPFTDPINTALLDPGNKSLMWIGTTGGGLYKWNTETNKQLAYYSKENGLPNNSIHCIIPDSLGYFWMSTNRGITRFNPKTETFTNFFTEDGLYESEFNRHHALMLPDGRIAFGGTDGYSVFYPGDFEEDVFEPRVYITRCAINNKEVDHRVDTSFLHAPINQLEHIELKYDQNSIDFQFAALQYSDPEKIKYRYQLTGYDKDWIILGGDNKIQINRLPPGKYTLLINATNTIGKWSSHVRELAITIHPPLWLTWWAYLIYVTLIGIMVAYYWRSYKNRLIAKQESLFNIREAARLRELDETKTRFFSNITHEFRTPLTLILSPLEKHLKDLHIPSNTAHTLLNNNYRHANQLLKLVNQLLDIAKLEAGQMRMNSTAGDFVNFIDQCVSSFQAQAIEKNIALTLSNANIAGNYLFDHEKWEKILFNLLSNAIKFTPAGGKVEVSISCERKNADQPGFIKIQVQDSGVGIEEQEIPKIFKRFYQVDDSATRKHEGTGIGLSLVKELVNLMGGTIDVSSVKNRGTSFTIEIVIEQLKEIPSAHEVTSINNFQIKEEEIVPGVDHDVPVILIVEDNEELRSFIKESLAANWHVLEASNGLDGWAIIERELPEIVISDVMMPGMTGFELCSKSKKDARTSHINFIMLTAKAAQESKIEGLESGADEYITKPFHLYELELRIRNLLMEQHSLRMHLQEKLLPLKPAFELPHVSDVFLTKLQDYIDNNIDNTQLQVDSVAEAMAMSRSTLNRKLKVLLNISIHDYVKKYRLQKAAVLLAAGHSVSDVTFRVGFESPSYFAQCFKEHFSQTPSEFSRARG